MEDTCSPGKNKSLQTHRIYSILIPCTIVMCILEVVYVISTIPGNLGDALTIRGTLPKLPPSAPFNSKKL
jgi:hypothetical protein